MMMNMNAIDFVPTGNNSQAIRSPKMAAKSFPVSGYNFQEFHPTQSVQMPVPSFMSTPMNVGVPDMKKNRSMVTIQNDMDGNHSDASTSAESSDNKKCKVANGKKEYKLKQKTEMCKNWEMKGSCRWGNKCSYAHGEHELVKKTHLPKNFMTRTCETFHKDGFCSFAKRCQFMHAERDVYAEQSYTAVLRENARLAK